MKNLLLTLSLLASCIVCNGQKFELIKDGFPGTTSGGMSECIEYQGNLYYLAKVTATDYALWRSDGTPTGTQILKQMVDPPHDLVVAGGKLFFRTSNHKLWCSDGTATGTQQIEAFSGINIMLEFNNKLYLSAAKPSTSSQIYMTDGVTGNATAVTNIQCSAGGRMAAGSTRIFFAGYEDGTFPCMNELYVTDGISTTQKLTTGASIWGTEIGSIAIYNNEAYFSGRTASNGIEICKSDGTVPGTNMLADINPGTASSYPYGFMPGNNGLYFFALDAGGNGSLFKTDGTALGTVKLVDTIMIGGAPDQAASYLDHNGKLLFRAQKGFPNDVKGIYATDGTSTGTYLVQHMPHLYFEVRMLLLGNHIYVGDFGSKDTAFWKFDETPNSGTIIKAPLSNNADYLRFAGQAVYKNAIYGTAHLDGNLGYEVYKFQDIPDNITDVDNAQQTARIYPLPVHDHATLELYVQGNIGHAEIAMYDMTGRLITAPVHTQLSAGINKLDINTASLANGMYHVVVRGDDYNEVIKIVK